MKYFTNPDEAFKVMNKYERRISEIVKKESDLTVGAEYRAEYEDCCGMIEELSEKKNVVKENALGQPSIFVRRPNDYNATIKYLSGDGTVFDIASDNGYERHPAFIINNDMATIKNLLVAKYRAGRFNGTNYAISLPMFEPARDISVDTAFALCKTANGGVSNIHMETRAEQCYESLIEIREGYQSRGNDQYGRSYNATNEQGIPCGADTLTIGGRTAYRSQRSLTGSGPLSWHMLYSPFEPERRPGTSSWAAGYRINAGELNWIPNNNAALIWTCDHSASSAEWKAYQPGVGFVDIGTEGVYFYDYLSAEQIENTDWTQGICVTTALQFQQQNTGVYAYQGFNDLAVRDGETDDVFLSEMLIRKLNVACRGGIYMRNGEGMERFPFFLGDWGYGSGAGPACAYGDGTVRGATYWYIGFALASYETEKDVA